MTDVKTAWFADHAPGRGKLIVGIPGGGGTPDPPIDNCFDAKPSPVPIASTTAGPPLWVQAHTNIAATVADSNTVTYKQIITSPDGITWTERDIVGGAWRNVCYSATLGLFVVIGADQSTGQVRIARSVDGKTWRYIGRITGAYRGSSGSSELEICAGLDQYGNGVFFFTCFDVTHLIYQVYYSNDGISWTKAVLPDSTPTSMSDGPVNFSPILFGNCTFVILGSSSSGDSGSWVSTNGIDWTATNFNDNGSPDLDCFHSFAFGNGVFVGASEDTIAGAFTTSSDGITWVGSNQGSSGASAIQGITFINNLFVAVTQDSANFGDADALYAQTSQDGLNWTKRLFGVTFTDPTTTAAYNIGSGVSGSGYLYIINATSGSKEILTSPDATTWTLRTRAGLTYHGWTKPICASVACLI